MEKLIDNDVLSMLHSNLCGVQEHITNINVTHYYDMVRGFTFNIGVKHFFAILHLEDTRFNSFYRDLWLITESSIKCDNVDVAEIFDTGINFWVLYNYRKLTTPKRHKIEIKQISSINKKHFKICI